MARIRSVHPGLFTDEAFVSLSPMARIFLVGLWTQAYDDGVFEWKPLGIKMKIIPGDNADASAILDEIERAGIVRRFDHRGKQFGAIRNFMRWQRPKKPTSSGSLPESLRSFVGDKRGESETGSEPVPHLSGTGSEIAAQREDGGREEGRKEAASAASARAPEPEDRKRLQIVEAKKAIAGAFREVRSLATPDTGMVDVWAASDWPLDLCVAVVRHGLQRKPDAFSLAYFEPAIRDAVTKRKRPVEIAPPLPDPNDPRVDFGGGFSAALSAIQAALDTGRWRDEWGPQLGSPGCRVPPEIASKFTTARAA